MKPNYTHRANFLSGFCLGIVVCIIIATAMLETAPSQHSTQLCEMELKDGVGNKHLIQGACKIIGSTRSEFER